MRKRKLRLKVVTAARLRKMGACERAIAVFRRTFGEEMRVTPANLTRAVRALGGWGPLAWLVNRMPDLEAAVEAELPAHNKAITTFDPDLRCPRCAVSIRHLNAVRRRVILEAARG